MTTETITITLDATFVADIANLRALRAKYARAELFTQERLYRVLEGTYAFAISHTDKELLDACKFYKIKATAATSNWLMANKLIFLPDPEDRSAQQKCSTYGLVMGQAFAAGIWPEGHANYTGMNFTTWIKLGGGIEAIRRAKSEADAKAARDKVEADKKAREEAEQAELAKNGQITLDAAPADADNADLAISEKPKAEDNETAFKRGNRFLGKNPGGFALAREVVTTVPFEELVGTHEVWLVHKEADGTRVIDMMTNDDTLVIDAITHLGKTKDKANTRGTVIAARVIEGHRSAMEALGKTAE